MLDDREVVWSFRALRCWDWIPCAWLPLFDSRHPRRTIPEQTRKALKEGESFSVKVEGYTTELLAEMGRVGKKLRFLVLKNYCFARESNVRQRDR